MYMFCSDSLKYLLLPLLAVVTLGLSSVASCAAEPSIEDYATVESVCNGVPVYSFSNIAYVYGAAPDLLPGVVLQSNNTNPLVKVKPKKSWEIKEGMFGFDSEITCRTAANDSLPFLPIHLILQR